MKKATWFMSAVMVLAPAFAGCSKKESGKSTDSSKSDKGARPAEPKVDKAAVRRMLQGKWNTGKPDKPISTFVFNGDKAEVTQHNIIDSATNKPTVYRGKLEITGPNVFR